MTATIALIELQRSRGQRERPIQDLIGRIAVAVQYHVGKGAVGAGARIVWIEIDRLLKQLDGVPIVVWAIATQVLEAT